MARNFVDVWDMNVELLRDPPPTPGDAWPASAERRRSRRFAHTTLATLSPADGSEGATIQVVVRNVSLHGVGLRSSVVMSVGESYVIDIGNGRLKLNARVWIANCRPRADGTYDVGAAFA
jgi:hypothetical protein